ncbi:MAG: hypothetical protein KC877_01885 [Candidatus Kaiserbacteria bacterium]|nr:hypothetical protein [Candidatus Kaiserbacteria bacterium]MCB9815899.1 hypothetical protein [Candidatus Nomurabacteria bacterium]
MSKKTTTPSFTKQHYGKWVALGSGGKILAYSRDLKTLSNKVGNKKVVYTKALDPRKIYAFSSYGSTKI